MKRIPVLCLIIMLLLPLRFPQAFALGNSWVCPDCAMINEGKFCTNCGKAKPVDEQTGWICPDCGLKNEGRFCTNCGRPAD